MPSKMSEEEDYGAREVFTFTLFESNLSVSSLFALQLAIFFMNAVIGRHSQSTRTVDDLPLATSRNLYLRGYYRATIEILNELRR